jgi:Fic family protein
MNNTDQIILDYLVGNPLSSSKEIHEGAQLTIGYATTKRALQGLIEKNYIQVIGQGRGTKYRISQTYTITKPVDLDQYFEKEIDEREIIKSFNFDLISEILPKVELFTNDELNQLESLQKRYIENIKTISKTHYQRELERLAIDLSWKSSQIEGNTYTLLETERLLKDKQTAEGKTKAEASMLLNHKEALDFILEHPDYLNPIQLNRIEDIHSILIKDLEVEKNIRTHRVGISGTNYKPLDNEHQIREALQKMCELVNSKENIFEKALLLLVLLSYIQAFYDGNKRTARIVSNACLIHNKHCPISFRTIDSIEYKKAMLLFYEQNNISAFKSIFIEQYDFAVITYF